jgi:hypothetical protein
MTMNTNCNKEASSEAPCDDFLCPLTLQVMEHPMMTKAGHSFERSAILSWLEKKGTHPLTREQLNLRDLVMNRALQAKIQKWKAEQGPDEQGPDEQVSDTDSSCDGDDFLCLNKFVCISQESVDELGAKWPCVRRLAEESSSEAVAVESSPSSSGQRRGRFGFGRRRQR